MTAADQPRAAVFLCPVLPRFSGVQLYTPTPLKRLYGHFRGYFFTVHSPGFGLFSYFL